MRELDVPSDARLLTGPGDNEDAAVVSVPAGKVLVQTVDFFTPIVNDPFRFGQIAAANSLSDIYAMGAVPWTAMNVVCFPMREMPREVLANILKGGLTKIAEAGAVLAGGHSVNDPEIKYGLSVTGLADPDRFATNRGLRPGDRLILTKPLGIGVLATAVKVAGKDGSPLEEVIWRFASRLNRAGADVIRRLGLKAATDITGFGLGGHLLEMSRASKWQVALDAAAVPMIPEAVDLAGKGFLPAGSIANRKHCHFMTDTRPGVDARRVDVIFDAQTSGGLLLAVPEDRTHEAVSMLTRAGDLAETVGEVLDSSTDCGRLTIR